MGKVAEFFKTWSYVLFLALIDVTVLFTLGSTIYTAVTNPFVGIVGIVGSVASLALVSWLLYKEIKAIRGQS